MTANELIRKYRILCHMTQKEVADRLGMTHSGYSKYERGERRITIDILNKLSSIIYVPLNDLKTDEIIFKYFDPLDFGSEYMELSKQIQARRNNMTEDEKNNARELFIRKYNEIETRKKELTSYLKPKKMEIVAKEYGIEFILN